MYITFGNASLAALCNSQRRLAERWGPDLARAVGRRLFELSAAGEEHLPRLPRAAVTQNRGDETIVDFDGEVVVRGIVGTDGAHSEYMVITGVEVQGARKR